MIPGILESTKSEETQQCPREAPLPSGRERNEEATGAIESLSLICDAVDNILSLC